jgi:hypothetical protein
MADAVAEPVRRIVMSLAHDMLANVVEHAAASRMSAVAVLLARRRPPLIQIGVADDGRGIPSAMLDRGDYRGFGLLHDASVVHAVLARGLTRRVGGAGEDGDDGRGGLSAMIAALMPLLAAVRVRSGAALVSATARSGWRRSALDHGHGSQMVVEVPLTA